MKMVRDGWERDSDGRQLCAVSMGGPWKRWTGNAEQEMQKDAREEPATAREEGSYCFPSWSPSRWTRRNILENPQFNRHWRNWHKTFWIAGRSFTESIKQTRFTSQSWCFFPGPLFAPGKKNDFVIGFLRLSQDGLFSRTFFCSLKAPGTHVADIYTRRQIVPICIIKINIFWKESVRGWKQDFRGGEWMNGRWEDSRAATVGH